MSVALPGKYSHKGFILAKIGPHEINVHPSLEYVVIGLMYYKKLIGHKDLIGRTDLIGQERT